MRRAQQAKPHKRDGTWYLIKRVPAEFAELDRRGLVRISTGIAIVDDPRAVRAADVVRQLDLQLQAYWSGLRDGRSGEARIRFEAAQKRARALGLTYQTNAELADGPRDELIERLRALLDRNAADDEREVAAVMGGEPRPSFLLSQMFDEYEKIVAETLIKKSENQLRKWRLPKQRAIANLIKVITDKAMSEVARPDALNFRIWWQDRVKNAGLEIATANKDIGHINKMWNTIDEKHTLDLKPVFRGLHLKGAKDKQRSAFEFDHVQNKILADGMLSDLNPEARHILYLIAETGLRLSEACNLVGETILLGHTIPHVRVRPDGREMKTDQSERDIPLVGVALKVMKLHPRGFPRYRDKEDSLSGLVNKVLAGKGLLPTDDHSLYSLRHTFEDRLTEVEAPEKVVASLMGHKWHRERYGKGPSLKQKQRWLLKIAFKPPAHL